MNLTIVRHAESVGNARGIIQGRRDYPLTERGREQAAKLRERFAAERLRPTRVYSSPQSRTFETARIACGGWDTPITQLDDLMETDMGAFSGLTWEEAQRRMPHAAREYESTRSLDGVPGAESYRQRAARARRVVERMIADHANDDGALLFSHGGIMNHIFAEIVGASRLWGLGVRNTAVFEFEIDVGEWANDGHSRFDSRLWRIERFNDSSHLA